MSKSPKIVRTLPALRNQMAKWRAKGKTTAFVPTMGALHAGHLSLITLGKSRADKVVASIYVNPTQFAPNEDFDAYPRTEEADIAALASAKCDLVYIPDRGTMYDSDHATHMRVGGVAEGLETDHRPTFFEGVAIVVTKLLNRVAPDMAIFGEKDYQQLATIRRLVIDLDMPIDIIGAPIARDEHGLALSSRNAYFDETGLAVARKLNGIMFDCAAKIEGGQALEIAIEMAMRALLTGGFHVVDYVSVTGASSLAVQKTGHPETESRLLIAAHCPRNGVDGTMVRLIDNCAIKVG
ncbi:pantoate--beta-alanine ligase [Fretibacter rubidus]|uniref:pantoate--beta-alanine ligase n=1 Tax=Fretibacter rubidus TaxID=570162 RepID=UPI00352B4150